MTDVNGNEHLESDRLLSIVRGLELPSERESTHLENCVRCKSMRHLLWAGQASVRDRGQCARRHDLSPDDEVRPAALLSWIIGSNTGLDETIVQQIRECPVCREDAIQLALELEILGEPINRDLLRQTAGLEVPVNPWLEVVQQRQSVLGPIPVMPDPESPEPERMPGPTPERGLENTESAAPGLKLMAPSGSTATTNRP